MTTRIGIISYGAFTDFVRQLMPTIPSDVELVMRDGIFGEALRHAQDIDGEDGVDVIVSCGSNGMTIKDHLLNPFVNISVSGIDVLQALRKALPVGNHVAVVTFQEQLPYMQIITDMVCMRIIERTYNDYAQLDEIMKELKESGVRDVVGSTLVCESARAHSLRGHLIYSREGVYNGIMQAQSLACARKKELDRARQFQTILQFTREGIVTTDEKGIITVFNKSAESITGIPSAQALNRNVVDVLQNTRLDQVIKNQEQELDEVQILGSTKILTNRVPIIVKGRLIGALATFQTLANVRRSQQNLVHKLVDRGFAARHYFEDIQGMSASIKQACRKAMAYARNDSTLLINGETGTGKELFAQSIHNAGTRAGLPFVAVNCAALPHGLLESELFGYEEGAFTGAKKGGKCGVFELAHTGTIFLDEIAEIPLDIQARLLRVLEQREVFRLGGERLYPVNVRVIAATNKNLRHMVTQNMFREDLYYRLNVLELHIPSLRERQGDVPLLFKQFLSKNLPKLHKAEVTRLAAHPALEHYPWPGNVRELRNTVERFTALWLAGEDAESVFTQLQPAMEVNADNLSQDAVQRALHLCGGNKSKAAKQMGISRSTLWRRMKQ